MIAVASSRSFSSQRHSPEPRSTRGESANNAGRRSSRAVRQRGINGDGRTFCACYGEGAMSDRPYRVRVLCEHCDAVIDVQVPRVGEDMASEALKDFGRAILEGRLVHAIMECAALDSPT